MEIDSQVPSTGLASRLQQNAQPGGLFSPSILEIWGCSTYFPLTMMWNADSTADDSEISNVHSPFVVVAAKIIFLEGLLCLRRVFQMQSSWSVLESWITTVIIIVFVSNLICAMY